MADCHGETEDLRCEELVRIPTSFLFFSLAGAARDKERCFDRGIWLGNFVLGSF